MATDLVLDESELSIAKNKIDRYFDFLEGCFSDYSAILDSIPGSGLEDVKITTQLFLLRQVVALQKQQFYSQCKTVDNAINSHVSELETADNFTYPDMSFHDIISILASFL